MLAAHSGREAAGGGKAKALRLILLAGAVPLLLYGFSLRLPMMGEDHFGLQALSRELYSVDGTQRIDVVIDPKVVREYPQIVPWWTSPDAKLIFLRPLTNWIAKGEFLLWKKQNTAGYHLTSLLVFALTSVLLYLLGCQLFPHRGEAFLGVLIFCCHPYNAIAVPWMAEKASIFSLCFGILGVYLHVRFRRGAGRASEFLAWLCFILAFMAKESGAVTLIAFFLYDLFLWRVEAPGKWPGIVRSGLYYTLLSVPLFLFMAYFVLGGYGVKGFYSIFDEQGPASAALVYMLKNVLLYPSGLLFFVPIFHHVNLQLLERPLYILLTLGGLALAVLWFLPGWKREVLGRRQDLFLLSWLFVSLLPILQLIVQNRYLYAASAPFALFMGSYLFRLREAAPSGSRTRALACGLAGFYVVLPAIAILGLGYGGVIKKLHGYQRRVVQEVRSYLGKTDTPVNVFFLNMPNGILTFALQYNFDCQGSKGEVRAFPLTITREVPEVEVLDERTLRVTSRTNPLLESEPERLFMTDQLNRPGLGRSNRYFQATVEKVEDGHVYGIRFTFLAPLDDPATRFYCMKDHHVVPAPVSRQPDGTLRLALPE